MSASSYVDKAGEWETRKISIIGALQSFISQLTVGEEITKVSLPAVLLSPYSAIELAAYRGLSFIHVLLQANREQDNFRRFLSVLRWYLTYTQKEKMKRKPYNPILAENHICWTETPNLASENSRRTAATGITKFFGEQTSHHPPITAFVIENPVENIMVEANVGFSTKFYGNSAGVASGGKSLVSLHNFNETYTISKCMPDIMVRNMILGTKRISWEGDIVITCQKTGYQASFSYKEEGWHCHNVVSGYIVNLSDPNNKLFTFHGNCGDVITLTNTTNKKTEPILEPSKLTRNKLHYLPWEQLNELSSLRWSVTQWFTFLRVWADLSKAIEIDDMSTADMAKRKVEDAQRKRRAEGHDLDPKYFYFQDEFWYFKKNKLVIVNDTIMGALSSDQKESQVPILLSTNKEDFEEDEHNKRK